MTSGRSRLTFSSSREATRRQVQPRHRTDKRRVEGLTDESVANQGDIYRVVTHQVLHVVKRQQYVQRGRDHPQSQPRDDQEKMVNVAEPGHRRGSQRLSLVWSATSQCSALAVSMARLTSASASRLALLQPGMERAGAENGDIGPVAGDQRQGGAAGSSRCLLSHWPPSGISWISARSLNS